MGPSPLMSPSGTILSIFQCARTAPSITCYDALYFSAFGCCKQLKPWSRLRTAATPTLPPRKGRIAFFSLTSGAANTALGRFSLHSVTTGFNTGIDAGTLSPEYGRRKHCYLDRRAFT